MRTVPIACCLMLGSIGCRTAVPLVSPAQDLAARQPRTLLLADSDHSVIRMTAARLTGDTLAGLVKGQTKAIPLSHLTEVRAVVAAPAKTAALAAGVGGATLLAVWMIGRWLTAPNANGRPGFCPTADPSSCS